MLLFSRKNTNSPGNTKQDSPTVNIYPAGHRTGLFIYDFPNAPDFRMKYHSPIPTGKCNMDSS